MEPPDDIACLRLPAPTIGAVNAWLLKGDPLTLVDTGPASDGALAAVEAGMAEHALRVEDLEQILLTHHHVDHCGLATRLAERSGAPVRAVGALAAYGARFQERNAASARYTERLLTAHGVPAPLVAQANAPYWEILAEHGAAFTCDGVLADGQIVRAGGRDLRTLHRPGHCSTDTLFVDDAAGIALVGDHVLARSSGCEIEPPAFGGSRPRALESYLANLRETAALELTLALGGHGRPVADPAAVIAERLEVHERRMTRLLELLADGPATAFDLGVRIFGEDTTRAETVLVVWDVLGHLDVLRSRGAVTQNSNRIQFTFCTT
ncbi:MAG TPA: MBL fold metallo-hydrolase [Solirubrobacteraceae bacterium]